MQFFLPLKLKMKLKFEFLLKAVNHRNMNNSTIEMSKLLLTFDLLAMKIYIICLFSFD